MRFHKFGEIENKPIELCVTERLIKRIDKICRIVISVLTDLQLFGCALMPV